MRNESNVSKKNFICSWRKKHLIRNRSMTFVSAFFCLASFHLWSQILPHKQRKADRSITRQLPPPEVGPFWPPVPPQENPNQANPSNSPTSEREQFYAKNITVTWIGTAGDSYNTFRLFFSLSWFEGIGQPLPHFTQYWEIVLWTTPLCTTPLHRVLPGSF